MSKTLLILAIFAFCLPLNVFSSDLKENENRELTGINLGDILKLFNGTYTYPTKNTTTPNTTTPVTNTTTPTTPTTPVTNTTTPTTPTTPVTNTTTPTTPTTPVTNTTTPVTNNTSSNNTTTDPVANTTQPSNPTNSSSPNNSNSDPEPTTPTNSTSPSNSTNTTSPTNTTNSTNTTAPVKLAKNDVNMTTFPTDCLRVHNQERMAVNLTNLTWSDSLAASAQAWAENMAVNGFRHSGKTGENIASSTYSTLTLQRLLGLWTKEQNWFIVGCKYPSCSNSTAEVGHYTQMVWHSTTQVGCGFAPGVNKGYNYLCCQYYKAGNVIGQYVY